MYNLTFEVIDEATPYRHDFTVTVVHEEVEFSPYIAKVHEYCPAPGQFVNDMLSISPATLMPTCCKKPRIAYRAQTI